MLNNLKTLLLILLLLVTPLSRAEFIGNTTLDLRSLTITEVVHLFTFFTPFTSNGEKVIIVLPPKDSLSFKLLATKYLKVPPLEYYESVQAKVYSGKANPIFTDTDDYVVIKVAVTPFSIGFHHDQLILNTDYGIRVIRITK